MSGIDYDALPKRISALEKRIDGLYIYLEKAWRFSSSDPSVTLNQCRRILEKLLYMWYRQVMDKELNKPTIGSMLDEKVFKSTIPRVILPKINFIREYGNLGSHFGEEVESKIAMDVINQLIDVIEWFISDPKTTVIFIRSEIKTDFMISVEILPLLKKKYSNWLRPDISSVRFAQDQISCYLEITSDVDRTIDTAVPSSEPFIIHDHSIERMDLDFIGGPGDSEGDVIQEFRPEIGIEENINKFVSELSTIIWVTELFPYDVCNKLIRYEKKHGKYPSPRKNKS